MWKNFDDVPAHLMYFIGLLEFIFRGFRSPFGQQFILVYRLILYMYLSGYHSWLFTVNKMNVLLRHFGCTAMVSQMSLTDGCV